MDGVIACKWFDHPCWHTCATSDFSGLSLLVPVCPSVRSYIHHIPDETVAKVLVIMHSSAVLWLLSPRLCQEAENKTENRLTSFLPISRAGDCITSRDKVFTAAVFQQQGIKGEVQQFYMWFWRKVVENWGTVFRQEENPLQNEVIMVPSMNFTQIIYVEKKRPVSVEPLNLHYNSS